MERVVDMKLRHALKKEDLNPDELYAFTLKIILKNILSKLDIYALIYRESEIFMHAIRDIMTVDGYRLPLTVNVVSRLCRIINVDILQLIQDANEKFAIIQDVDVELLTDLETHEVFNKHII